MTSCVLKTSIILYSNNMGNVMIDYIGGLLMEFLFEFVLEIFGSIFFERVYGATNSKRIPLWIQISIVLLLVLFFGGIVLGSITFGLLLITEGIFPTGVFMVILGVLLTLVLIRKVIVDFKSRAIT